MDNQSNMPDNSKTSNSESSLGMSDETSKKVETFTAEAITKAVNDALAKAGRDTKSLSLKEAALRESEEKLRVQEEAIKAHEREIELREIEAVKDDPVAVKTIEYRRKLAEREREVDRKEKEANEKLAKAQSVVKELSDRKFNDEIKRIAGVYGVEEVVLKDLGIEDIDKIESIAKHLPSSKQTVKADSGKTIGGQYFTREQISDREFWKANKEDIIKAQKEGRIK
ncbi:MAG: hypothetical protein WC479_10575 [Candidatus Izemoplasmatales bacterium]|nr:hypothetical protein KKB3_01281 [Dehalococcoides mccartyi]